MSAFFRQDRHGKGKDQQQYRIQPHGDFFRQKARYRRHGGAAQIRDCHLGAHEGLGQGFSKPLGCGVEQAGINGGAAQPCENQSHTKEQIMQRQEQQDNAHNGSTFSQTHHGVIGKPQSKEAAEEPSGSDAQIKQGNPFCGSFRGNAPDSHHITAAPKTCGQFQCGIEEKCRQSRFDAWTFQQFSPLGCLWTDSFAAGKGQFLFFPQRQGQKQDEGQCHLQEGNGAVACLPAHAAAQTKSHDVRPACGADAPETVEPAHMLCFAVEGNEVVQGSVYGASSKTVGNCPKTKGKETIGKGEAQKGKGGHGNTAHGDAAGAKSLDDPMAHKAG